MEQLIAHQCISTCENEFMLPIEYLYEKEMLTVDIVKDLELLNVRENDVSNNNETLYDYVFDGDSSFGEATKKRWSKYYTTDVEFLKDSQMLYKQMDNTHFYENIDEIYSIDENRILEIVSTIEDTTDFEERNHYIKDVYLCDKMNQHESMMSWYSCFLVASPLITLCLPIFIMIMPLFIIKSQGFNISIKEYFKLLFVLMKKIPIGKVLEIDWSNAQSVLYAVVSIGAYIFQLYQSFSMCLSFRRNMVNGHGMLITLREYLRNTVYRMEAYIGLSKDYTSYTSFNKDLCDRINQINDYVEMLEDLPKSKYMIPKKIGKIRCEIYKLYMDKSYKKMIYYANNFNGYLSNICAIQKKIGKHMAYAKFKNTFSSFKGMYYPAIVGDKKLNDVKINNNKIITGVNASGKTTLLKTVLFNVILSQQIGCGFYKQGKIAVYDKIHCYLNIPDTNGRDSLFQAEARRCKDIIESVKKHDDKRHLCVFDELYSGTNPYEASATGHAYIKYMSKNKNVKLLITTHYLDMCESLLKTKDKSITNYHMEAYYDTNNKMVYTYKKKKGITKIKGGVEVLKNLNYPKTIVEEATELIGGDQKL